MIYNKNKLILQCLLGLFAVELGGVITILIQSLSHFSGEPSVYRFSDHN